MTSLQFQIGKNGLTEGVAESLTLAMKNHKQIRISVLKSSGRDKNSIKEMAQELCDKLPKDHTYTTRIIGFTILLRRHPKK